MKNSEETSKLLRIAIELEEGCSLRFHELAQFVTLTAPSLSATFQKLAREEGFHAKWLEGLHRQFLGDRPIQELTEPERNDLEHIAPWLAGPLKRWVKDLSSARSLALRIERDSIGFYDHASRRVRNPELARALREFCGKEQAHWKALKENPDEKYENLCEGYYSPWTEE